MRVSLTDRFASVKKQGLTPFDFLANSDVSAFGGFTAFIHLPGGRMNKVNINRQEV